MRSQNIPGSWPLSRIVEVLGTRCAIAAMRGKPTPVAVRVLQRLEAQNGGAK